MAEERLKVLIAGDSFAAKWPGKYPGWAELLEEYFDVTNLAQAGVGEYKILRQVHSVDVTWFDCVIVCHTSFSRIHTREHPVHKEGLHINCDLIYTDLEAHNDKNNPSLKAAKDFFQYHYDESQSKGIYYLIRSEIARLMAFSSYIAIDNFKDAAIFSIEKNKVDLSDFWLENKGEVNHYSEEGNKKLCQMIREQILQSVASSSM
jgi:hypothetical protein